MQEFDIPALRAKLVEYAWPGFAGIYPVLIEQQFPRILDTGGFAVGKGGAGCVIWKSSWLPQRPDRKGFSA